jgi:diaminohydroxyphosphoribosylaminopyrimidine deaminase/5-amino-6-(5-phosphoribosylamino)uracil reductase
VKVRMGGACHDVASHLAATVVDVVSVDRFPEPDEGGGPSMASTSEAAAMRRALVLASSPDRSPHPNPRVGAVIVDRSGRVVGEGLHRGAGHPHAEVEALRVAGDAARGATAVVTLEPCDHTGRTPPCTQALLSAGVARVVFGLADPNPTASGGEQTLRAAGVDVEGGVLHTESRALNLVWALAMERRRPYVTWKVASSIDGRVAARDGSSRWITGPAARGEVHAMRAQVDAVVVGTGTVRADDPQLTARDETGRPRVAQPLRVVVGERPIAPSAKVFDHAAPTLLLRTHSPQEVVQTLFDHDVHHALLESGPTLSAAFLRAGAVDRAVGYAAPTLLGDGRAMTDVLGVTTLTEAERFAFDDVALVGEDLRWTARLSSAPAVDLLGGR